MANGIKGTGTSGSPTPVSAPGVQDTKKPEPEIVEKRQEQSKPAGPSGRSAEGLAHDPAVAMRKNALLNSTGLKKPTKAELEEIRNAIKDGKKEEAIKLAVKYYNIDTSGAKEVKYAGGVKPEQAAGGDENKAFKENKTGTSQINGKIIIGIGDESFQFKGKDSPEWLAAAIYHESFHAKNHFRPDKPAIVNEPANAGGPAEGKMTQQEIAEEIQAYVNEEKAAGKLGLNDEMLSEIANRRNKLYAQLTDQNRQILSPILRGTKPWPQ